MSNVWRTDTGAPAGNQRKPGADGLGVGYGFGIVPKGECAGMIYDRKEYRNGVEI
jgi:hypothetical protein